MNYMSKKIEKYISNKIHYLLEIVVWKSLFVKWPKNQKYTVSV